MAWRRLHFGLAGGAAITSLLALVSCLSDPREDETVTVISACDMNALSNDPANPQASLRTYVTTAEELLARATAVEAELKDACNAIDTDLGLPTGADPLSACNPIAARAANIVKNSIVPSAPFLPSWAELRYAPLCDAPPDALEKCISTCAGPCDATKCEPTALLAVCQGKCNGTCITRGENLPCRGACVGDVTMAAPSTCGGECQGVCTGPSWYGRCEGACAGTFVGRCEGTCTGKCSAEFKEPKCTGEVKPPEMSADCKAHCDADVSGKMECTPAQVGLAISGAADAKLASQLQATIEKNFPLVLKVAIGIGERGIKVAGNVQAVVEGVSASVETIAQTSGDPAKAGLIAGQITACLGDTFKGALSAAGSLKANVNVSVDVKASASASAGGSAKAGTGAPE